ncbi:MAG TPA: hypothetical protein VLM76_09370 [Patescibacteria group bacterium]|nr:hypothetical protein [Patescibacteria group bacterium]
MAIGAPGAALTERHRLAQIGLRAALVRDLVSLWPLFDPADLDTFARFSGVASGLIAARHRDSATIAQAYYARFREAEAVLSVPPPPPRPPRPPVREQIAISLRATGLVGAIAGVAAGFSYAAAKQNAFAAVAGAAGRLALDGGRQAILDMGTRDPRAMGWQRVTAGDPCAFCAMLASRGVMREASGADFEAHDHCACSAEPVFEGSAPPPASARFRERWDEVTRGLSGDDARNAFRRSLDADRRAATASH